MTTANVPWFRGGAVWAWRLWLVSAALLCLMAESPAEIPQSRAPLRLAGIYKVVSSTDPSFPASRTSEYFFDFGQGLRPGRHSGSVAVSLRRNPHVQVRIMAWQYFPERGELVIGSPTAEGSRVAVARAVWNITGSSRGALLERGNHRIVIQPPAPGDY